MPGAPPPFPTSDVLRVGTVAGCNLTQQGHINTPGKEGRPGKAGGMGGGQDPNCRIRTVPPLVREEL